MTIAEIIVKMENLAPLSLQEDFDNAGLITGNRNWDCKGALISLDATEEVIDEAIALNCNLVIAHHPIVFRGLKKFSNNGHVERVIIKALKHDIAIYACHTNLDNVIDGVNGKIADQLGLTRRSILSPKRGFLKKLAVFVPEDFIEPVEKALFTAGAGNIGNYSECSFVSDGKGSFKPEPGADPYSGQIGIRQIEKEFKIEVVFPEWLQNRVVSAMKKAHPYEDVAHEIYSLSNSYQNIGSGLIGELSNEVEERQFLSILKDVFKTGCVKHTPFTGKKIKKVAVCGGAGSFLTAAAIASGADVFITADIKYHDFFDADGKLLLADVGHFESEQYTIDLIYDVLRQNFPTFALLKTKVNTNPVQYS